MPPSPLGHMINIGVTPPIIATIDDMADDDGFVVAFQTKGLRTTPCHLASVTIAAITTTLPVKEAAYNFLESSEEEVSQHLLTPPAVPRPQYEDLATLLTAISESKHRHNLAINLNITQMDKINQNVLELISSTRVLAEASARTSTMFGQCMDAMEGDLVAIERIVEESMASNSKFAADPPRPWQRYQ